MNERDWIAENLPEGAALLSGADAVYFCLMGFVVCEIPFYRNPVRVETHWDEFEYGTSEWNLLQSALDFAQRIEHRRGE